MERAGRPRHRSYNLTGEGKRREAIESRPPAREDFRSSEFRYDPIPHRGSCWRVVTWLGKSERSTERSESRGVGPKFISLQS